MPEIEQQYYTPTLPLPLPVQSAPLLSQTPTQPLALHYSPHIDHHNHYWTLELSKCTTLWQKSGSGWWQAVVADGKVWWLQNLMLLMTSNISILLQSDQYHYCFQKLKKGRCIHRITEKVSKLISSIMTSKSVFACRHWRVCIHVYPPKLSQTTPFHPIQQTFTIYYWHIVQNINLKPLLSTQISLVYSNYCTQL